MSRTNKKPAPQQTDLFDKLRAAEEAEVKLPAEAYDIMVNTLAADSTALEFEEVQSILKNSGHTAADLERHIAVVRPFVTGKDRAAQEEIAEAQAEVEAVGAERTAIRERLGNKPPSADDNRRSELLSRRLAQAHRRIKAANAKLAEFKNDRAALVRELRGEPEPERQVAEQPKHAEVTVTSQPSSAPAKYDPYDHRWRKVYNARGEVFYEFNGQRVSA